MLFYGVTQPIEKNGIMHFAKPTDQWEFDGQASGIPWIPPEKTVAGK
jgi:hypothetical protein